MKLKNKLIIKIESIFLRLIKLLSLNLIENFLKFLKHKIVLLREERFGHQIGDFAVEIEKADRRYKKEKYLTFFIFYTPLEDIANIYLREIIIDYLKKNNYKFFIFKITKKSILFEKFIFYIKFIFKNSNFVFCETVDIGYKVPNKIINTSKSQKEGLKELGIKNKYICIYARDNTYLSNKYPNRDFSYHNYRNNDINRLQLLSEYASETLGYDVIRVGSLTKNTISWERKGETNIIDYSNSKYLSPKNDIDIITCCEIFINGGGGPSALAIAAGRQIITINHLPIRYASREILKLWIPKLIINKETNEYLSLKNIEELGLATTHNGNDYLEKDLKIIENSENDILNIFLDYFKIKNNKLSNEEIDLINEYKLKRKATANNYANQFISDTEDTMAPSFLKSYPNLLK